MFVSIEKRSDFQKALGVVLEMLDFACWRRNLDVWKFLKAVIDKLQLEYVQITFSELDLVCVSLSLKRPQFIFNDFFSAMDCFLYIFYLYSEKTGRRLSLQRWLKGKIGGLHCTSQVSMPVKMVRRSRSSWK